MRDVDLRAAVREVTADFRAAADAAGIELIVNDVPAAALCDPDRLHQMLVNLVGNAVKYTPHGGNIHVTLTLEDDRTNITVSDTGIGISEDELPHLFERFFRSTTAIESHIPGTGLGLAITHALAQAQNGHITARRREAGGMTFTLDLPRAPVAA